jgi:hypothetical protein
MSTTNSRHDYRRRIHRLVPDGLAVFAAIAAGGIWSTPTDLADLAIEVQKGLAGATALTLSKKTTKEMLHLGLGGWNLGFQIGGSAG